MTLCFLKLLRTCQVCWTNTNNPLRLTSCSKETDRQCRCTEYYASAGYTIPTNGVYKTATLSTLTATTRSNPASAAGATTTPTPTSTPTPSPIPASSSGLSSGAKAGIGVGAAVGALAIIGIAGFLWMRRRKTLRRDGAAIDGAGAGGYGTGGMQYQGVPSHEPQHGEYYFKSEMPTEPASAEMDTQSPTVKTTHEMQA
ncbi:MAG: hypothetical protein Q9218_003322 [Villophora microphyllina]